MKSGNSVAFHWGKRGSRLLRPGLLLLLLSSCGSDDRTDPDPVSRWQPIGQDSAAAATFARIDGAAWGSDEITSDTIAEYNPPEMMSIVARIEGTYESQLIGLSLRFNGIGTYPVTVTPVSVADAGFSVWPTGAPGAMTTYYAGPGTSGVITVTVFDQPTQRIEGEFWFTAVRVGGNPREPDQVALSNGVFRGFYRLR